MTLYLYLAPRLVARWSMPNWTEDIDLIVARLRDVYWRVEVVDE